MGFHRDFLITLLIALSYMRLSERQPDLMDRAGKILDAMIRRKEEAGVFSVTDEGLRSFFDASCALGTTGIGCVLCAYAEWFLTDSTDRESMDTLLDTPYEGRPSFPWKYGVSEIK